MSSKYFVHKHIMILSRISIAFSTTSSWASILEILPFVKGWLFFVTSSIHPSVLVCGLLVKNLLSTNRSQRTVLENRSCSILIFGSLVLFRFFGNQERFLVLQEPKKNKQKNQDQERTGSLVLLFLVPSPCFNVL